MRKQKPEDSLEEFLKERTIPDDPELASLARTADRLEHSLDVEAPDAYRERALFIQGIAARRPGFPWQRLMAPVMIAALFVAFVAVSRDALPGDALYGARKTLNRVGLAEDPSRSAKRVLDGASSMIVQAEQHLDAERFAAAQRSAFEARFTIREAVILLEEASGEAKEEGLERVEELREQARELEQEANEEILEKREQKRNRGGGGGGGGGSGNKGGGGGGGSGNKGGGNKGGGGN